VLDVLWPVASPGQRLYNYLGAFTFYAFAVVVVTSYFRPKLGYRPWKKLHYITYVGAPVMYVHGTLIDQNLKGQPPDWFDPEKLLVEGCFLLVAAATIWRWRHGTEKQRYQATRATVGSLGRG
jgi:DMSO/TMAO reductase YedYZ heme-binding membrane subunit